MSCVNTRCSGCRTAAQWVTSPSLAEETTEAPRLNSQSPALTGLDIRRRPQQPRAPSLSVAQAVCLPFIHDLWPSACMTLD